jgi:hypothetical protein
MFSLILLALSLLAFTPINATKILVSKSAYRENSLPIENIPCLSRNNFIYLSDPGVPVYKVTWYTKTSNNDLTRNNNKINYFAPFDFKGGTTVNALPWDTTRVSDGEYFIYANVYTNSTTISKRYVGNFIVCNNYSFLVSDNENMFDSQLINIDTIISQDSPLFVAVVPLDDVVSTVVTYNNNTLPNLLRSSKPPLAFVADFSKFIPDFFNTTQYILQANSSLITGSTAIRRVLIPPLSTTDAPTISPTTSKPTTVKPTTVAPTTVAPTTVAPTTESTAKPTNETDGPTFAPTFAPTTVP